MIQMEEKPKWEDFSEGLDRLSVLFVDDEDNVLRSIKRVFRNEPYKIITANSADEALEIMNSQPVQMIVSDQRMPKITGIELLEKARQLHPDTIRVMLTGYSDLKTAEQAINRVEIYRFLSKPWNDEDLKATIRQGLEKWQLERANEEMLQVIQKQNRELQELNRNLEKRVEERTTQLKDAQARLVQTEKMVSVGLLAGGIAHEINNPLGGILGITQLLLMDFEDNEQVKKDLRTIEDAVMQCKDIVQNLQNFARQKDPESREPVIIPHLVKHTLGLINYIFRDSDIKVVQEYEPDIPYLYANPQKLQQVIINLLKNAQQAMNGGGEIFIRGRRSQDKGLVIEVEDQGEGIPDSIREKIFDPFFTTRNEGQGTGLGLSVAYGIVKEHNGKIDFQSQPGKGTCMRIVFDDPANKNIHSERKDEIT